MFYYSPSHIFQKQSDKNIVFLFGKIFLFSHFSILFHTRRTFSRNLFRLELPPFYLPKKKTLPHFENESVLKNFFSVFLSSKFSFILFHLLFVSSFIFFDLLLEFMFLYLHFLHFFEQQLPFPFVSKQSFQIFTFYMHALPLCVLLLTTFVRLLSKNLLVYFPFC